MQADPYHLFADAEVSKLGVGVLLRLLAGRWLLCWSLRSSAVSVADQALRMLQLMLFLDEMEWPPHTQLGCLLEPGTQGLNEAVGQKPALPSSCCSHGMQDC